MLFKWPATFTFIGRSRPEGQSTSCDALLGKAMAIAETLKARDITAGDRVALWLTDGEDHVAAMLGCWIVGAAFCVLPAYAGRSGTDLSKDRTENVLSVLQPRLIVQRNGTQLPESIVRGVGTVDLSQLDVSACDTDAAKSQIGQWDQSRLAFIQFTSGSTGGGARGAEVRFSQLEANLDALAQRTGMSAQDRMVSWAPLYHDMGLMAVLLSIRTGADLILMETDQFVRRPGAWLEAMTKYKGTVTTAPPTALKLLTRRRVADLDLRSWRYAWIGGEAVFPKVLRGFEEAYATSGLASGVLQPTYGMAETVVGISCGEPGVAWAELDGVASCGRPLSGLELRIVTATGEPVTEGREGNVLVRGTSVISGYLGLPQRAADDWFDTGDLGFLANRQLFITGRHKDVLKRGAESYPATLVEAIAEEALSLRTGRVAAFTNLRQDVGKEEIVLLVESPTWTDQNARQVGATVMEQIGLQIDVIRAAQGGRLPRTSSGKLMRQLTAAQYREGLI